MNGVLAGTVTVCSAQFTRVLVRGVTRAFPCPDRGSCGFSRGFRGPF
jgi:hypothetical protein